MTQVLLLTGMTPDDRIFQRVLERLPSARVVTWIPPQPQEALADYAARLADSLPVSEEVIVCGVSFGGIVARELAARLNARACVLVSSISDARELPPWFRLLRPLARRNLEPLLDRVGKLAAIFPRSIRTAGTARLTKFAGPPGSWHRWATTAVLRWQAEETLNRVRTVRIHGDRDRTFPLRYVRSDVVIAGGGHVLPLTHAEEVANLLRELAAPTN